MQIPSEFQVFGQTWKVILNPTLRHDTENIGEASYRDNVITLQSNTEGNPRALCLIEASFLHELVHVILDCMSEHKLRANEKFVDVFANLLHQVLTSSKYTYVKE
jgi:hypothetical protein